MGEAILKTSYLINIMPTCVLQYVTLPDYLKNPFHECRINSNLPLKNFCYAVYVHIPSKFRSKLNPRAEKCVFIGYAPNEKRYKCYNSQTQKTFVSMNVSFLENQSYFSKNCL